MVFGVTQSSDAEVLAGALLRQNTTQERWTSEAELEIVTASVEVTAWCADTRRFKQAAQEAVEECPQRLPDIDDEGRLAAPANTRSRTRTATLGNAYCRVTAMASLRQAPAAAASFSRSKAAAMLSKAVTRSGASPSLADAS